jgi:hypothetical protein
MKKPGNPGFFIVLVNADPSNEPFDWVLPPATALGASAKAPLALSEKKVKPKEKMQNPYEMQSFRGRRERLSWSIWPALGARACSCGALPHARSNAVALGAMAGNPD